MSYLQSAFLVIVLFVTPFSLYAKNPVVSLYSNTANRISAELMAKGRISVVDTNSLAALQFNPSLLVQLDGIKTEIHSINQDRFLIYQNIWAFPTAYGNMAVGYSIWDYEDNFLKFEELNDLYYAYSIPINQRLQLGAGFITDPLHKAFFVGAHIPFFTQIRIYEFLGFWDLNYGGSLKNLNIENTYDLRELDPSLSQGFDFKFINSKYFEAKGFIETEFNYSFINRNFRVGCETTFFDYFVFMFGGYGSELMKINNPTYGFGGKYHASHVKFNAFYSQEEVNGFKNKAFSFRFDFSIYGEITKKLSALVFNQVFSPRNSDGKKDVCIIKLKHEEAIIPKKWTLYILDYQGNAVKHITSDDKLYLNQKKIPETVIWNGRDDENNFVADGEYTLRFQYLSSNNIPYYIRIPEVTIDNTSPSAKISIENSMIFMESVDDEQAVNIDFDDYENESSDIWYFRIYGQNSFLIDQWEKAGDSFGSLVKWIPKDKFGVPLETGVYRIEIFGKDSADNISLRVSFPVQVNYRDYAVTIQPDISAFSPNNDKIKDLVYFNAFIEESDDISRYSFLINNADNRKIFSRTRYRRPPPGVTKWTGRSNKGIAQPDGLYFAELYVFYRNKRKGKSFKHTIEIDTVPPLLEYKNDLNLFSPDGDGDEEVIKFDVKSSDNSGIDEWQLEIVSRDGSVFRTFRGYGNPPEQIYWDGTSDKGVLVRSFSTYTSRMKVWDRAGNSRTKRGGQIEVDFLIFNLGNELRVQNFGIEFRSSSHGIYPGLKRKLDKIGKIMAHRLRKFNVKVEGFSDLYGSKRWGKVVSKKRAVSVRKYLLKNFEIDESRIEAVGRGMESPITKRMTVRAQRINRRVEFYFEKIQESNKE